MLNNEVRFDRSAGFQIWIKPKESLHSKMISREEINIETSSVASSLHLSANVDHLGYSILGKNKLTFKWEPHLLLVFSELSVTLQSGLDVAIGVEEVQHQLQGVSVHVHVQPVLDITLESLKSEKMLAPGTRRRGLWRYKGQDWDWLVHLSVPQKICSLPHELANAS